MDRIPFHPGLDDYDYDEADMDEILEAEPEEDDSSLPFPAFVVAMVVIFLVVSGWH